MADDRDDIDLLQKNWEIVQRIIAELNDRSWKIKAWAAAIWWAVVSYSVPHHQRQLIAYLLAFLAVVFCIDVPTRIMQDRFLSLTSDIERALTSVLARDEGQVASQEITTNVDAPDLRALREVFTSRRVSFWFPYIAMGVLTVVAFAAA